MLDSDKFFEDNKDCFEWEKIYIPCSLCNKSIDVTEDKEVPTGFVLCSDCADKH